MQLVLSNNRVVAHGENFLAMGGVVINTETGAKYENATVAECDGCPSDIDKVGYEYHAGVFVPCAPYGVGNNNGFFMEVCESCATPRSSGIPIKHGLTAENMHPDFRPSQVGGIDAFLLWENASPNSSFSAHSVTLLSGDYTFLLIESKDIISKTSFSITVVPKNTSTFLRGTGIYTMNTQKPYFNSWRYVVAEETTALFGTGYYNKIDFDYGDDSEFSDTDSACIPIRIYGVKL